MLIMARSGLGGRGLVLTNGTGVIDSDFRGEVKVKLSFTGASGHRSIILEAGDRVAQAMLVPIHQFHIIEVAPDAQLSETDRGTKGYGSTGTAV